MTGGCRNRGEQVSKKKERRQQPTVHVRGMEGVGGGGILTMCGDGSVSSRGLRTEAECVNVAAP